MRKKKRREWQVRLQEEIRQDKRGKFVTLSFSDESLIKLGNEINTIKIIDKDDPIKKEIIMKNGKKHTFKRVRQSF